MTALTTGPNSYVLMTDISEYQAGADLFAHKDAGFDIISLRASSGSRLDRVFDVFADAAVRAGIRRLYYAWVNPRVDVGTQIALIREAHAMHGRPQLGWMLDVEDTGSTPDPDTYAAIIRLLVNVIVELDGRLPVIYTANWYWDARLPNINEFADCPLIVASYPFQSATGADLKAPPDHWTEYGNWAFTKGDRGQAAVPRSGGWETWSAGWQISSVAGLEIPGFIHRGVRGLDINLIRPDWVAQRLGLIPGPGGSVPPHPFPPPPTTTEDAMLRLVRFTGNGAVFLAPQYQNGLIDTVRWISPALYDAYLPHTGDVVDIDAAAIPNVTCIGPVPPGNWPFFRVVDGGTSLPGLSGPPGPPGLPGPQGPPGPTPKSVTFSY